MNMTQAAQSMAMPSYVSHKKVWALEIDTVEFERVLALPRLTFRDEGYAPIEVSVEMFARYKPVPGDFYVVYDDGYKSFSPRKAFLDGYTPLGKSFREIKQEIKHGL